MMQNDLAKFDHLSYMIIIIHCENKTQYEIKQPKQYSYKGIKKNILVLKIYLITRKEYSFRDFAI